MNKDVRSPAEWRTKCLEFLKDLNPGYRENLLLKNNDRYIEFVRQQNGLFWSHNFLQVSGHYYYASALLFSLNTFPLLCHVMMSGSRFNNLRTNLSQLDDFGLGFENGFIWSDGPWRSNTMENLQKGMYHTEKYILGKYLQQIVSGKKRLIALFDRAAEIMRSLPNHISINKAADLIDPQGKYSTRYKRECSSIDTYVYIRGGNCHFRDNFSEMFAIDEIPLEAIISCQISVFFHERDKLSQLIDIFDKL
ncbi:MAG: hypothetical protein H6627_00440 [Calditrichae bacterium]|nr:hypothetical protein [Calditrichia bacterium]